MRARLEGELAPAAFRAVVLAWADYRCEVRVEGCTGLATDAHHRFTKGRPNVPANGVAICASCHTGSPAAIHRNYAWAYAAGLLVHSWDEIPTERWAPKVSKPLGGNGFP